LPAQRRRYAAKLYGAFANRGELASGSAILGNMYDPKAKPPREELTGSGHETGLVAVVPELKCPDDLGNAIDTLRKTDDHRAGNHDASQRS
jgi:hypothetical protein